MRNVLRAFCLCSAMIAASCLNGCSKADPAEKQNASVFQQTTISDYNITKPPDDGWTLDELLGVTYLYGKPLTSPLTLNSLGKDVEGRDKGTNIEGHVMISVYHDDEYIAAALYDATSEDEVDGDTPFSYIQFFKDDKDPESLVVNGKRLGTDYGDMADHLGKVIEDNDDNIHTIFYKTKDDSFSLETIYRDDKFASFVLKRLCNNNQ
ncbi:hypothetical protein [Ruminococcus sp.]|uniref:hypothetical protein n=1 Tax=Ruminococcus sp. TaxID=41978 RepID=UPI0025DF81A3|nr:hypothetical protein [Ruminococcus sp.]